jgi:hypothetical protein
VQRLAGKVDHINAKKWPREESTNIDLNKNYRLNRKIDIRNNNHFYNFINFSSINNNTNNEI